MILSKKLNGSIIEHFKKAAVKYADKIAVKSEADTVTYKELDKLSDKLASVIISELGVKSEPVIFFLEYGINSVIAILGILKAGKFYTALDKAYSDAFISYIIEDTETKLIITDKRSVSLLPKNINNNAKILFIEDILLSSQNNKNINVKFKPNMPAALLYTSGSTGQPKGIIIDHLLSLHSAWHSIKNYNITSQDYILDIISFGFLPAAIYTFSALFSGASLYLYDIRKKGGARLYEMLSNEKVTVFLPPISFLRQFFTNIKDKNQLENIRLIKLSGDHLYFKDIKNIRRYISEDCLIINASGSSEAGVITWFLIDKDTLIKRNKIPVGYPPEYKEILILDEAGNKVCDGEVGEIAVKSRYLASGYWKDPELTKKKFLQDPKDKTKQIYFTGDLGRIREDGCLEYIGRKDFMVKIRGYRVEIEAVEAALLSLDYIKEAAVKAHEEKDAGTKYFAAYIVYDSDMPPTITELREDLKKILPDYMIPSYFIMLDKMPYTASFKIDRKALPAPEKGRAKLMKPYKAPTTELEKKLAKIWGQTLQTDNVGIDDDFFDLGGNSLLAIRLIFEIERKADIKMPKEALMTLSTVADMAQIITEQKDKEDNFPYKTPLLKKEYKQMLTIIAGCKIPAVKPGSLMTGFKLDGFKNPIFWCAVNYEQHPKLIKYLRENQPFYGMVSGIGAVWRHSMDIKKRREIKKRVAAHYVNEILKVKPNGHYILAGNCNGARIAMEIASILINLGKKVEALFLLDFFDESLFDYPSKMALIYSKEGSFKPYKSFIDWNEPCWEKKFVNPPQLYNISGGHEEYFKEPYVIELADLFKKFLNSAL